MTKRIQFEFSADAASRMHSLKERTSAKTYGEVIRDALRVYEWMHEVDKSGLDVAAIKDGEIVRVVKLL